MAKLTEHSHTQPSPPSGQDSGDQGWNTARDGVASVLAKRRDALGLKLTDVAAALRIRAEYLMALERGSLEGLPGPAYAMGFLRAYADYLGFDGKDIVRRFKAEQTSLNAKPELTFPMPLTQRGIPGSGLLLTALILVGLGYGTWYYLASGTSVAVPEVQAPPPELLPKPAPKPVVLAKPIAVASHPTSPTAHPVTGTAMPQPAVKLATATPIVPPMPQTAIAAPPPSPRMTITPSAAMPTAMPASRIVIVATATTWFQLSQNHKPIVTKMLKPGDQYPVPAGTGISLWTGNAGGIHLVVDGHPLAALGRLGQAIRHIPIDPDALLATPRH